MATSTPGNTAADQTRSTSPNYPVGCWTDSGRHRPTQRYNHQRRIAAMPRQRSLQKNSSSSAPRGSAQHRLNLAAFRLARFITSEALAHGDVEAVLFDVAARLGIPPHEARATIARGLRAGLART